MKKVLSLLICLTLILSIGLVTAFADPTSDDDEPSTTSTETVTPSETTEPTESTEPSETTNPSESPEPSETVEPTPEQEALFDDVPATGKWYSEPVRFVVENGYMVGISDKRFAPETPVTRGMVTTILYALDGKPSVKAPNKFRDVEADKWYTTPVIWANYYGIVAGYEDGSFRPNRAISRQELAAILYKYSSVTKKDVTSAGNVDTFKDKAEIASWALTQMKWAVGQGLLSGMGNNTLAPKGTATRAQLATIIKAFVTKLDNGQHTAPVDVPITTPTPVPSVKPSTTPAPVQPIQPTNNNSNSSNISRPTPTTNTTGTVYWTPNGKSYHSTPNCSTLKRSKTILSGPKSSCPKSDPCNVCVK